MLAFIILGGTKELSKKKKKNIKVTLFDPLTYILFHNNNVRIYRKFRQSQIVNEYARDIIAKIQ